MPWGEASIVKMDSPLESNDGPILWVRPGEQMLPTAELNANRSPTKRKRTGINELRVRRVYQKHSLIKLSFTFLSKTCRIFNIYLVH